MHVLQEGQGQWPPRKKIPFTFAKVHTTCSRHLSQRRLITHTAMAALMCDLGKCAANDGPVYSCRFPDELHVYVSDVALLYLGDLVLQ